MRLLLEHNGELYRFDGVDETDRNVLWVEKLNEPDCYKQIDKKQFEEELLSVVKLMLYDTWSWFKLDTKKLLIEKIKLYLDCYQLLNDNDLKTFHNEIRKIINEV